MVNDDVRGTVTRRMRQQIADLTAERDALAERVRLGDELKRALDSWLLTGDGWEDVGAARAAIAERDDDDQQ